MSTLLQFTAATGSWAAHYWTATETLSDGHYVEYVITELVNGVGYGINTVSDGSLTNAYVFWYNSGGYILLNGSTSGGGDYTSRTFAKFDRIRFRKSGNSIIVSQNGEDFHTISLSGTVYAYAASFNGTGSVDVDSVNGSAVTTLSSAACTVTLGVPSTDYFANDSALYYTPIAWIGSGRSKASSQPGALLRFDFTGSRAGVIFDATSQVAITSDIRTKIAYRIDGGDWTYHTLADETLVYKEIATGLSSGTHTAEVVVSSSHLGARYDATNRYAEIISYGARVPTGQTVSASQTRPRLIVGYGDSNSEGSQSVVDGTSNSVVSFSQLLADAVGANLALTSVPGQGWITTPSPGVIPTMQNGWDLNPSGSSKLTTGMLVPEPNLIFICHGQNDSSSVTTDAASTINEILSATTTATVVVMCPCGRSRRSELIAAVAAVNSARCVFFDNPTNWLTSYSYNGLGVHLTAEGHVQYAAVMIPQILALLPAITVFRRHHQQQQAA